MRAPFSPINFILFILALAFLVAFIQVGLLTIAFDKLGLSQGSAFLLLFTSLFGSLINLPLFQVRADPLSPAQLPPMGRFWKMPQLEYTGHTVVALNVGGGVIPAAFSLYLLSHNPVTLPQALAGIGIVALVSYLFSRPVPGLGIGMPILVAPVCAALAAVLINNQQSAPLAYISGTMGVLVGADLLHLKDIRRLGAPVASIGGAGTFDGIFITGIVAVLLA
jgi:uncharacterized membrane protein